MGDEYNDRALLLAALDVHRVLWVLEGTEAPQCPVSIDEGFRLDWLDDKFLAAGDNPSVLRTGKPDERLDLPRDVGEASDPTMVLLHLLLGDEGEDSASEFVSDDR